MSSRINELENEGIILIGRGVREGAFETPEQVRALAETTREWAKKTKLDLGLVWCGTTINWPDDIDFTPAVVGLLTFSGFGDDDEPVAGVVPPSAMDPTLAQRIPAEFWTDLETKHGLSFEGEAAPMLACAGWTWARLERQGAEGFGVSTEDSGYLVIPEKHRAHAWTMRVGYC